MDLKILFTLVLMVIDNIQTSDIALRNVLKAQHHPNMLPVRDLNRSISIKSSIRLKDVVSLDERKQQLTTVLWLTFIWKNEWMQWNTTEYKHLKQKLMFSKRSVWIPDIYIQESVDQSNSGNIKESLKGDVSVQSTGETRWSGPLVLLTECRVNIRNYPFDTQNCHLTFGSWSYSEKDFDMAFAHGPEADISVVTPNVEWNILSCDGVINRVKYDGLSHRYVETTYTVVMQRRTIFHLSNVVLPGVVIAVLIGMTFLIPPLCGERIGFCVTNLLTVMLFSLSVSEITPRSAEIPIISKFLTSIFVTSVAALIVTCFTIKCSFTSPGENEKLSWFFRVFTNRYLATILFVKNTHQVHKNPPNSQKQNYEAEWIKAANIWDKFFLIVYVIVSVALFIDMYFSVNEFMVH